MVDTPHINMLINKVQNSDLRNSLNQLEAGARDIWNPSRRIINNYTDHGIEHSDRIAGHIMDLIKLYKGEKTFSDMELYTLSAGICLHDIGMQCDVVKYPLIKIRSEEVFNAKFDVEFRAMTSSDYSQEEQESIRDNHHCLTAAWIDFDFRNNESTKATPLSSAIKSIPDHLVKDVIDVCLYHSKLDIEECNENFSLEITNRKRLVAALLRFGDELDIDWNRVSDDAYRAFRIPPSNEMYWRLHSQTSVNFDMDNNTVCVLLRLNPAEIDNYGQLIKDIYLDPFERKNGPILKVLSQNSIPISISSKIKPYNYTEELPDEVVQAMITLNAKMNRKESIEEIAIPDDIISSDDRDSIDKMLRLMVESLLMTTLKLISQEDDKILRKSIYDIKQAGQLSSKIRFLRTAWQTVNSFNAMSRKIADKKNFSLLLLIAEALNDIGSKFASQSELNGAAYEAVNALWAIIYITNDNVEFDGRQELRLEIAKGLGEIGKIAAEKNSSTVATQAAAAFGYFSDPSKELIENMNKYLSNILELSNYAMTCFHIASSLNALNLPDGAEKAARKAISIDAEHSNYFLQLCNALKLKAIIAQHDKERYQALDSEAEEACSEYRRLKAVGK